MRARRAWIWLVALTASGCTPKHAMSEAATSEAAPGHGAVLRRLSARDATIHPDGSVTDASSPYRFDPVRDGAPQPVRVLPLAGDPAARVLAFEVPTDASGHKERIELKIAKAKDVDGLHFDNARAASFRFRLASPAAAFLGSAIVFQAWQGFPYGPPLSLKIVGGKSAPFTLKLAVRDMTTGPDSTVADREVFSRAMIVPDVWYRFDVLIAPRVAGGGRVALAIDGVRVVDWAGPIGYDPRTVAGAYDGLDLKLGLYQPNANNGHRVDFDAIELRDAAGEP